MQRYIGYGITNNVGIATLDFDSNGDSISPSGLAGYGRGELDLVAKLHEDSTIVSAPYTVTDCVMYDKGIQNDPQTHDIYSNKSANLDFQRTLEYSSIKSTGTTYASMRINSIPSDCVVDLEVCQIGGVATDQIFRIVGSGAWKTNFALGWLGYTNSDLGTWIRLRYSFTEGSATMTSLDDSTKTHTRTFTGLPDALMFSTANTDNEVRFRNVKVYPL